MLEGCMPWRSLKANNCCMLTAKRAHGGGEDLSITISMARERNKEKGRKKKGEEGRKERKNKVYFNLYSRRSSTYKVEMVSW